MSVTEVRGVSLPAFTAFPRSCPRPRRWSSPRGQSARTAAIQAKSRYAFDSEFENTSYIERFVVLGKRLLRERVYQAVWVAVVDLENGTVEEPDPLMTYSKFLASLKGWIEFVKA